MAHQMLYKTIQDDIISRIASGALRPGDKLMTEKEIMEKYRVSHITVQRALTELKQKGIIIRRPRAGSFVSESAHTKLRRQPRDHLKIGVVAPFDISNDQSYHYLDGLMKNTLPERISIMLHNTKYIGDHDRIMLTQCIEDHCDGILYYPGVGSAPPLDILIRFAIEGYPCVLIDKQLPGVELPCVETDNEAAGYELAKYMLRNGHTRMVFVLDVYAKSIYDRYTGFCKAMHESGVILRNLESVFFNDLCGQGRDTAALLRGWIEQGVTAVCCGSDSQAKALLSVCGKAGINVPGKISLAGIDGIAPGIITSMQQPYMEIGRQAMDLLVDWIAKGAIPRQSIRRQAVLIEGTTTRNKE